MLGEHLVLSIGVVEWIEAGLNVSLQSIEPIRKGQGVSRLNDAGGIQLSPTIEKHFIGRLRHYS